jgi:hypothetical protein
MKAAVVMGAGQTPRYSDFSEPMPDAGESRITVTAAATVPAGFKIATNPVPLSDVEQAWTRDDSAGRTVLTIGAP